MLKLNVMMTAVLIALFSNALNAQTLVDFESLTVPESGYFNGSTEHSGTVGSTETFTYAENGANFYVNYTLEESYDYWTGYAYSNQTDLQTTDWTSYSAYANPAGGADGSENYVFAYSFPGVSDSIMFDNPLNILSMDITNTVWAYAYMSGDDGSGNAFTAGDYLKIDLVGIKPDGSHNETPVSIYLGQNTDILSNWTGFDVSDLGTVKGIIFTFSSSDIYAPNYFCLDNIVYTEYSTVESVSDQNIFIFPNPAKDHITIGGIPSGHLEIIDLTGRTVLNTLFDTQNKSVDMSSLKSGMYIVKIGAGEKPATMTIYKTH